MCCREDQECCDDEYIDFKLTPKSKLDTEEAGEQFAEWIVRHVGSKFYKGFIASLKYVGLNYDITK